MLVLRIPNLASERVMKRESGENPEQTRCCKASLNPSQRGEQDAAKITNATVPRKEWEGFAVRRKSQKTCHCFTTVNGFREIKLENDSRTKSLLFTRFIFRLLYRN